MMRTAVSQAEPTDKGKVMAVLAVTSAPAGQDADDRDLVAAVRVGDDRAFEALYLRYQARVTTFVRGMVRDHGRAEDITQDVFISALRRLRANDAPIAFKPWIYEIAKNACIDAWRRSRNTDEVSFDAQDALGATEHGRLADPGMTPDSAIDTKDAIDNLCGAFGGLSPTHHEILVMREFEGLSYREIGERLGMSRPGVESTLFRARRRLSEEYEELVSGERCLRVQRIVDSPGGRASGLRDQRRMARHLAHCQPCRRYAHMAGVDLGIPARPAVPAAAKIAAWFPLPLFLRRRWGGDELVGQSHHGGSVSQWSASVAGTLDPGLVSSWSKAAATAATVAVAGLGAGAAIHEHRAIERLVVGSPPAAEHAAPHRGAGASGAQAGGGTAAGAARRAPTGSRTTGPASADGPGTASTPVGAGVTAPTGAGTSEPAAGSDSRSPKAGAPGSTGVLDATGSTPLTERPIGAPPSVVTGAPASPQPLSHALDGIGPPAGSGAGAPARPPAAPAAPHTGASVSGQVDALVGTLSGSAPTQPAAPAKPAAVGADSSPPTAGDVVGAAAAAVATVTTAVTGVLTDTPAGRPAP